MAGYAGGFRLFKINLKGGEGRFGIFDSSVADVLVFKFDLRIARIDLQVTKTGLRVAKLVLWAVRNGFLSKLSKLGKLYACTIEN